MEVIELIGAILALIMMTILGFGYVIPLFLYFTQGIWEAIRKRKEKFNGYPQKLIDAERKILELEIELEKYTQKDTPSKKIFWTKEMRALYKPYRLLLAQEENIVLRINSLTLSPSYRAQISPKDFKKEKNKYFYETTLTSCTCKDFTHNTKGQCACKHMFALALHLNLITDKGEFVETTNKNV